MPLNIRTLGLSLVVLVLSQVALAEGTASILAARTDAENIELIRNMECIEPSQRGNQLTEGEALAIARGAIAENDTWPIGSSTFRTKRDDCGWDVLVVRESPGPGDHRFVRINAQGKVLAYVRGM